MDNITEEHIERFVQFPETLTDFERKKIASAISGNPEFKQLADWFTEFYEELNALNSSGQDEKVIPLIPIKKSGDSEIGVRPLMFAAMSSAPQRSGIKTVATLASEEAQIVARILQVQEKQEYKIHLIRNEQPAEDERTIFTIEELNMDLVLDSSRHLSFDSNDKLEALDWNHSSYSLRIPLGQCKVVPKEVESGDFRKTVLAGGNIITIAYAENQLKFEIQQSKSSDLIVSRVLINGEDSDTRLIRLDGEQRFSLSCSDKEVLTIQFFR